MTEEIWKDIPGYEGRYQASSLGRIRSVPHTVRVGPGAAYTRVAPGRVLRPACSRKDGHLMVVVGKGNTQPVHTLVAAAFLGPRPEGADVRHLDGDCKNNSPSNLAYGSRTENILDVYRIGGRYKKLSTEDVLTIRRLLASGVTGRKIAEMYGVRECTISAVKTGRTFAWLTDEFCTVI